MPLFYQHNINQFTRLAIWKIEESESFFSATVPLHREITHPHKRLQHLAGRYLLRYLYPAFPYEKILIAETKKPFLSDDEFHFSISHCSDYAAAIVSTKERVGIDIETHNDKASLLKTKFLSESERSSIDKLSHFKNKEIIYTLTWCMKETMFKWFVGSGIDFKKMLGIDIENIAGTEGKVNSKIILSEEINLLIQYKILKEFCLSYSNT